MKQMSLCLLAALLALTLVLPAAASSSYMEHEGLQITVEMDQQQYDDDAAMTATITVVNTNPDTVTITNLEQLIPEGYRLAEDSRSALKNLDLLPGEVTILQVTFEKEPEPEGSDVPEDFFGKLLFGETMGLPNLLVGTVLAIAVVVFFVLT